MAEQIILYGCGGIGQQAFDYFGEQAVACFCETVSGHEQKRFGKKIITVDELGAIYQDYILIISTGLTIADEIADMLNKRGIEDFLVYESIRDGILEKMSSAEFIEKYSDKEQRSILQRDYYKSRLEGLQSQLTYLKKHVDITTLKPATGYLRKWQMDEIRLVNEIFDFVKELQIKPFLMSGGLIGAIRHNGFVPWDDDLDFGLMREDYEKLLDFCKKNCHVYMFEGSWEEYKASGIPKDLEELIRKYPNQWIVNLRVDDLSIMKANSYMPRAISFWVYDYYKEDYTLEEHTKYLSYISEERKRIDWVPDIIRFLRKEIYENKNISKYPTGKIQPGIDNGMWILLYGKRRGWIQTADVLPLKRHVFEGTEYFIPQNPEAFLAYEYPNFMEFPDDLGEAEHLDVVERYTRRCFPSVEFYPFSVDEIKFYLMLYKVLEEHEIYTKFIIEPTEKNIWKNEYEEAVNLLDANAARYGSKCSSDVDFVFMTQESSKIKNYRKKKIYTVFQFNARVDSVVEPKRTYNGFDYRFICTDIEEKTLKKLLELLKGGG